MITIVYELLYKKNSVNHTLKHFCQNRPIDCETITTTKYFKQYNVK